MMRLIFNHLLIRILDLASERLMLLAEQHSIVHKWAKANKAEAKDRHMKDTHRIVDNLLRNRDYVRSVLEALEESRPKDLTKEQDRIVNIVRKMFRWSLGEYRSIVEYATEVKFDKGILEELSKNQVESS